MLAPTIVRAQTRAKSRRRLQPCIPQATCFPPQTMMPKHNNIHTT